MTSVAGAFPTRTKCALPVLEFLIAADSMADMSEFLGFLGNVLAHWIALMSGLFSLVLALIGQALIGKAKKMAA